MSQFLKVFTRKVNTAAVKTDKAEEKLLEDDQYVPPPGHIGFLKELRLNTGGGHAKFVSLGGSRMQEVRTWNHASEIFSRTLHWKGQSFEVADLSRLPSFKVTTSNKRTSKGSVTIPLHGATFVDFEKEESNQFHLLIAHGQNLETFTTNDSVLIIKGDAYLENVNVIKWLPKAVEYSSFNIPAGWKDGSEYVLKRDVPSSREGI